MKTCKIFQIKKKKMILPIHIMGPCKMHWRSGTGGICHGAHTSQTMGHRIFLYMGQQLCLRIVFLFIHT